MNKLYGLYFVPVPGGYPTDGLARFVSASLDMQKLSDSLPHVTQWNITNDPNDKTLRRYSELPDNSKYLIREIPFIC